MNPIHRMAGPLVWAGPILTILFIHVKRVLAVLGCSSVTRCNLWLSSYRTFTTKYVTDPSTALNQCGMPLGIVITSPLAI